jgi:hypothetical protein
MLAVMTDTDIQSKLAEYEGIVRLLTVKLEELAAENARLRSEKSDALSFLKEVYNDPTVSPAHRIKAAGLALPHEVPRLTPVPPALELQAEPAECLADTVHRQRARMDQILRLPLEQRSELFAPGRRHSGNGNDDDSSN